ncbi:MAG: hypothetical protein MZW92_22350 [Comamonadaceae bacterium]|nr:hypothetical protein [Comamonadaceae bacterium]
MVVAGQVDVQVPAAHTAPPVHAVPHDPQFVALLCVSTQPPPQSTSPAWQLPDPGQAGLSRLADDAARSAVGVVLPGDHTHAAAQRLSGSAAGRGPSAAALGLLSPAAGAARRSIHR